MLSSSACRGGRWAPCPINSLEDRTRASRHLLLLAARRRSTGTQLRRRLPQSSGQGRWVSRHRIWRSEGSCRVLQKRRKGAAAATRAPWWVAWARVIGSGRQLRRPRWRARGLLRSRTEQSEHRAGLKGHGPRSHQAEPHQRHRSRPAQWAEAPGAAGGPDLQVVLAPAF